MNASLLTYLGLCRRAGYLDAGFDSVCEAIVLNKVILCLVSDDCSEKTLERLTAACAESTTPIVTLPFGMDAIGKALGRAPSAVLAVKERGFALGILDKTNQKDKYPQLVEKLNRSNKKKTNRNN